jgi:flagellar biosynthesis/type III secretory pathway M-ring protein FliF/YscJ
MFSMQSIWQVTQHLSRRWDAVPGWLVLLLATALLSLCAPLAWQLQRSRTSAQTGELLLEGTRFSDSQLGPILQALAKAKLTDYVVEDHRIRVPRGQQPRYLTALAQADALPRDFQSHTAAAMQQNHIFETDRDRQRRLLHAREKDLAQAIRSMEGIDDAMVQFDEVEQRGFQQQRLLSASVAIRPREDHVLDRHQIRAVRCLVAATKAGMKPADVSVTDLRSGLAYVDGAEDQAGMPAAEEYLRVKRAVEREWQHKVAQVLSFVPAARIAVDVELATDASDSDHPHPPLTDPRHLAISVAVPESYLVGVWRLRRGMPAAPADRLPPENQLQPLRDETETQIRHAVLGLVPDHFDMASVVTVTTFQDLTRSSRSLWPSRSVSSWIESFSQHRFAWIAVALVGILAAWSTRWWRHRSSAHPSRGTIPIQSYQAAQRNASPSENTSEGQGEDWDERELRATLTDLVRENPDGAAEMLHHWIDKAG